MQQLPLISRLVFAPVRGDDECSSLRIAMHNLHEKTPSGFVRDTSLAHRKTCSLRLSERVFRGNRENKRARPRTLVVLVSRASVGKKNGFACIPIGIMLVAYCGNISSLGVRILRLQERVISRFVIFSYTRFRTSCPSSMVARGSRQDDIKNIVLVIENF